MTTPLPKNNPIFTLFCGLRFSLGGISSLSGCNDQVSTEAAMNDKVANESLSKYTGDLALDAAVALDQMRFGAARMLAQAALDSKRRVGGQSATADAFPTCIIAQVLYEEGRLDDAEGLLAVRLPDIRRNGTLESALRAHRLLARVAASRRQYRRGLLILRGADALAVLHGCWPRLLAASLAHQVELHLAGGAAVDAAAHCLQQLEELAEQHRSASGNVKLEILRLYTVARARLALARAPLTVDIASLLTVHYYTVQQRDHYTAVSIALLLVDALLVTGARDEAVGLLSELLWLAPAVGLHQTLVDCSAGVAGLIEAIVQRRVGSVGDLGELLPYANVLLSRRQGDTRNADEPIIARRSPMNAGLSERERLIVGLMGRGLSNKQIAIELCIAPETVKSHAKRLYTKLSVRNRTEAVTLASCLGLFHHPTSMLA
jgi:ATP/maltotriose-dependent transcriptional regulator MalT